ncbi:DUF4893 domain-containing protein [Sphingomonas sp. R86521]|uniref:DUF4893 domain-containing protein n=1 Tax=Sphingomonas sp. R86521 TaxID=3093860 RepID=UPI0036D2F682
MRACLIGVAACMMVAGCGGGGTVASPGSEAVSLDWRRVATADDRGRLRGWRGAWINALSHADPAQIAREPALFDPDHAVAGALPPPGAYRCRTFKLGARTGVGPTFTAYGWFACRIDRDERGQLVFGKASGSQRPSGTIYPDTDTRSIFLGTMVLGDETRALDYGRDAGRDMAGVIERIGAKRWRLVLPYPRFESVLDVVELVPAR